MPPKADKSNMIFQNQPNVGYIMQVLAELLSRQSDGEYEYTVLMQEGKQKKVGVKGK